MLFSEKDSELEETEVGSPVGGGAAAVAPGPENVKEAPIEEFEGLMET